MPSVVPSRRARAARSAVLAALALLLTALVAGPAAAHNTLRSSDPADGATVPTAPAQVTLTFDQAALELGTQVVVTGPDGAVVSDGAVQLVDVSVVQPLVATRPAGAYTVAWRVTSADGHPLSGTFAFTAAQAVGVAPSEDPTAEATSTPTPAPTDAATPGVDTPDAAAPAPPATTAGPVTGGPLTQDATPGWVWAAIGAGAFAALAGGLVAVVAARRSADTADAAPAGGDGPAVPDPDGPGPGGRGAPDA